MDKNNKQILLEVYKQECENVRFFEDLKFKLHFFVCSGVFIVLGHYWNNRNNFEQHSRFLLGLLMSLLIVTVIYIVKDSQKKHLKRIKRLSKIGVVLFQDGNGIEIYNSYKLSKEYNKYVFVYMLYGVIASPWLYLIVKNINIF
jgi:hypothetical protein